MSLLQAFRSNFSASARYACCCVVLGAFAPAIAFALPGYANLINGFCKAQGAPRVRYTDDGCTLCHHPGTFTADAAHRVEPVWSEFELGRGSGEYRFFCPTTTDIESSITSTDLTAAREVDLPAPTQGGPLSHAEMPWMSLGYPSGHAKVESLDPNLQVASSQAKQSGRGETTAPPVKNSSVNASVTSSAGQPSDEAKRQLDKLRADLGLSQSQQAAWADLQDAVLATRTGARVPQPASAALADQIEEQQRQHALSIARLRAVDTALVRLNSQLNERQQRLLAARLPRLLDGR